MGSACERLLRLPPMGRDRPNVALIVFDTARADAFEPYGAAPGSTPVVADLARSGSVAERCYATSNWTLPSHLSMFTGTLPNAAGLMTPGVTPAQAMEASIGRSFVPALKADGFTTYGVSTNAWVRSNLGFSHGFDRWQDIRPPRRPRLQRHPRRLAGWVRAAVLAHIDDGLAQLGVTVRDWIDRDTPRPFFLFANLMECHAPYLPPKPYNDLRLPKRLLANLDAARYESRPAFIAAGLGALEVPDAALQRMRYLYARAVRSMDDWLGTFLQRLDDLRLLQDTIVIVASDHGENLGDNGYMGHQLSLDDRLIRVPLVSGGGVRVDLPAGVSSLGDVPRLVADAVGIADHPWTEPLCPDGVAISQFLSAASFSKENAAADEATADRYGISPQRRRELYGAMRSATDGRFKLVRTDDHEVLYDLELDPLETKDVAPVHPDNAARLRQALDAAAASSLVLDATDGGPDPVSENADLEERMRILGYL